jgi:predicted RNA binding protein YcfA (HicA-like mRNA interferase family)
MSKFKKALDRLQKKPKDFTWQELETIMKKLGYEEHSNSGSARRFFNPKTSASVHLHEPHPNPTIKRYALEIVIDHLVEQKLI